MTRHLLRLIWNRKRHNLLLSIEIFFSFIVVLAVTVVVANVLVNWRQPLGYRIDNVWRIQSYQPHLADDDPARQRTAVVLKEIFTALRGLPGIQAVAGASIPPYSSADSGRVHGERDLYMGANSATDGFAELMGLQLVGGRWFSAEDAGSVPRPVVINERLARAVFGDADPVGQILPFDRKRTSTGFTPDPERVVGVITDFRKGGELYTPQNYIFSRIDLNRAGLVYEPFPNSILVRVAPGTTAEFEETILEAIQPLARDWAFSVRSLESDRQESFDGYMFGIGLVGILGGFLLLMVALGLIGVVWQMVTERTREFGLRRAKGAAAANVRRQVLTELVLIASLAVVPGALLAAQVPVLPLPKDWVIPDGVFLASVAISTATIYLVVLACGWYPSRLATRIQPAEALHYE